jgi:membrane protein implicated in regulation of membrane protease activity
VTIELYHITLSLFLLLLAAEFFTGVGFALAAAIGVLPVVLFHLIWGEFDFTRDVFSFSVTSFLAYLVLRRVLRKNMDTKKSTDGDINDY